MPGLVSTLLTHIKFAIDHVVLRAKCSTETNILTCRPFRVRFDGEAEIFRAGLYICDFYFWTLSFSVLCGLVCLLNNNERLPSQFSNKANILC